VNVKDRRHDEGDMSLAGTMRRGQAEIATVLVVEDEFLVRTGISLDLADAGYSVIEAHDAAEALAVLEAKRGIDLVFSDIHMPGPIDGVGLCRIVRRRWPHIPFILTSAHGWPARHGLGSDLVFIPKPYLPTAVLSAVGQRIGATCPRAPNGAA
jgi:CheY-like chemotaxis protein